MLISNASGASSKAPEQVMSAAIVAGAASIVGSLAGVAILHLIATRAERFGAAFLAASGSRIMFGVLMCFAAAQVLNLTGAAVWYCFLGAAMLGLIFETAWAVKVNTRLMTEHRESSQQSVSSAAGVAQ